MTRDVDPKKASGYITKATNSLEMAKLALQKEAYDNAVMSAVHSSINALDALTTYFLGKRASGSHTDVLLLTKGIFSTQEQSDVERQYKSLIGLKNASEYQPDLMSRKQAEGSIRSAERILAKVKAKIQV
ncbi:MAG: HEPN domain-containing protein [Nitrosopumilaceae archaeon]